jgi:hypothetical protein
VSLICAPTAEIMTVVVLATVILGLSGVVPAPLVDVGVTSSGVLDTPRNTIATAAVASVEPAVPVTSAWTSSEDGRALRQTLNLA